jgi:inhibitor of cysteine peptidase
MTLEEAASGSEVTLVPGQELNLALASNVTTGYQWELAHPAAALLAVLDPGTYHESPAQVGERPLAGRGGMTSFRFRAVRSGMDTLHLVYRRPWEKEQPPARTFLVHIRVR